MQQDVLEFYKLLTSVSIEKLAEEEDEASPTMYEKFRCSVRTAHSQGMVMDLTVYCISTQWPRFHFCVILPHVVFLSRLAVSAVL
jgi:hypothetical protein